MLFLVDWKNRIDIRSIFLFPCLKIHELNESGNRFRCASHASCSTVTWSDMEPLPFSPCNNDFINRRMFVEEEILLRRSLFL